MSRTTLAFFSVSAFVLLLGTAPASAWVSSFHRLGAITAVRVNAVGDVVAAGSPGVVRLNGADGSMLWRAADVTTGFGETPEPGGPIIAIDGAGAVVAVGTVGNVNIHVTKLNGDTGAVVWSVEPVKGGGAAVAVDSNNDVIVAGGNWSNSLGLVVVKLAGSDGALLWQYGLAGGFAWTVTVDGQGDVFAAGTAPNPPHGNDLAVVKLDGATGAERWRHLGDGGANGLDFAYAIGLDAVGDVAAAGIGHGVGSEDFTVVKLSGVDGSEQWHYAVSGNDPNFPEGEALAVAFDAAGDVVAAGTTASVGNTLDFTVVKLAGDSGAERWSRSLHGTAPWLNADNALQIAVDSAGNVLAAGWFSNLGNSVSVDDEDFAVVKLAGSSGDQQWRAEINGKPTNADRAFALAVDAADNAITGGSVSNFYADAVVAKLSDRIPARRVRISDPGDPARRRFRVVAAGSLVIPAKTSAGDPTASGAEIRFLNPMTGELDAIPLPALNWTRLGSATSAGHGYRYSDPTESAGPCRTVLLTPSTLRADCRGAGLSFSLDEASQGSIGVVLTTGADAGKYCMLFGAPRKDQPGIFVSTSAPQPSTCPTVP